MYSHACIIDTILTIGVTVGILYVSVIFWSSKRNIIRYDEFTTHTIWTPFFLSFLIYVIWALHWPVLLYPSIIKAQVARNGDICIIRIRRWVHSFIFLWCLLRYFSLTPSSGVGSYPAESIYLLALSFRSPFHLFSLLPLGPIVSLCYDPHISHTSARSSPYGFFLSLWFSQTLSECLSYFAPCSARRPRIYYTSLQSRTPFRWAWSCNHSQSIQAFGQTAPWDSGTANSVALDSYVRFALVLFLASAPTKGCKTLSIPKCSGRHQDYLLVRDYHWRKQVSILAEKCDRSRASSEIHARILKQELVKRKSVWKLFQAFAL